MSVPSDGRMTVQLYERGEEDLSVKQRGESEVGVLSVVISYGDHMLLLSMDEERDTWEVEVIGQATVYVR